jgi:hypothetical protein
VAIPLHQLLAGAPSEIAPWLAPDVVFHSPVADYRGRDDVAHLLAAIASCLDAPVTTAELAGPSQTATVFVTAVSDRRLDGVLLQACDDEGLLAEATLQLRPLAVLRTAVERMKAALAADPLPSSR